MCCKLKHWTMKGNYHSIEYGSMLHSLFFGFSFVAQPLHDGRDRERVNRRGVREMHDTHLGATRGRIMLACSPLFLSSLSHLHCTSTSSVPLLLSPVYTFLYFSISLILLFAVSFYDSKVPIMILSNKLFLQKSKYLMDIEFFKAGLLWKSCKSFFFKCKREQNF